MTDLPVPSEPSPLSYAVMGALFAESFADWLRTLHPEIVIGNAGDCLRCPIANYLLLTVFGSEVPGADVWVEVDALSVSYSVPNGPSDAVLIPDHRIADFVDLVDNRAATEFDLNEDTGLLEERRPVTVGQALAWLVEVTT